VVLKLADNRVECFPPIADANARILILGSMPGVESLRAGQYYAHPRNAFWSIMGDLFGASPSLDYAARSRVLKTAGIALWDVLASCVRAGSLDSAITGDSIMANDFPAFFQAHPRISHVFFNGAMAEKCFLKAARDWPASPALKFRRLPSTSPAHAGQPYAQKLEAWRVIADLIAPP
jgi:hypoxanthine-DNA glycosylase